MQTTFWIAVGSAIGGASRYWVTILVEQLNNSAFPWGTLIVNVSGSFLIGIFVSLAGPLEESTLPLLTRQIVMVGILGGFTTFSAFSLQTLELLQSGNWVAAGANIVAAIGLCMLGVWVGYNLGLLLGK